MIKKKKETPIIYTYYIYLNNIIQQYKVINKFIYWVIDDIFLFFTEFRIVYTLLCS